MPIFLAGNTIQYPDDEARQVLGGYLFAQTPLSLNLLPAGAGIVPQELTRARWSCFIYDFHPSDMGKLNLFDLIVNIGLSSQIQEMAIAGMLAIAPHVDEALFHIPPYQTFWDLPRAQIAALTPPPATPPVQPTNAWWMWRASSLLDAVPGVGIAIAHKTLHHKRPWLFPLLDSKTLDAFPSGQSWLTIYDDLDTQSVAFTELEDWAREETTKRGLPSRTRLRIHDILLWCERSGDRGAAPSLELPLDSDGLSQN